MPDGIVQSPLVAYTVSICGLDEIYVFKEISHAISILDPGWPDPREFAKLPNCRRELFRFHDIIDELAGQTAPARKDIVRLLAIGERLQEGPVDHLLIHCHAGVSRSTASAAILLAQFNPGMEEDAFREVERVRPWSWPNSRMIELADRVMGREGRMVAAMRRHHGRMIAACPQQSESLRRGQRAREYRLARLD